MEQRIVIALIVVLAALGAGYFLLTGLPRPAPLPELIIPTPEPVSQEPEQGEEQIREIQVSGTEFSFSPNSITFAKGEMVQITFTNAGSAPHDFTLEGLGIKTRVIGPGQTDSVEFTAPAAGNYTFFCSVAGHRQAGMEGIMEVE